MTGKIKQSHTNGIDSVPLRVAIVGGGLVGSLAALHLGQKGHDVHLYEYRNDIRESENTSVGRSINLALSVRGRKALAEVGLEAAMLRHGIPMRGRMLHDLAGRTRSVPYDSRTQQSIYSVGRKYLNELLLNATEKYPNIHRHFEQKMVAANLDEGKVTFLNTATKETNESVGDLVIGCDGAFSAVRRQMLQRPGFDYSQEYIEHGYLELCIPPAACNQFAMAENYLHIWPRGKFMMIALPNQDKTWTVTLFMPFEQFNRIVNKAELLQFFTDNFPDSIRLIGEQRLIQDFFKTRPQPLVSIKCRPYHVGSKVLLMGDAAHAMVPFYGQGMNAGFEDCTLLSALLNEHGPDMTIVLRAFSDQRWQNAHAICDLAMYNYVEMRDLVNRRSYRLRKCVDDLLFWLMPGKWMPLYNSVSFSHMPYKDCVDNRRWQDRILSRTVTTIACLACGLVAATTFRLAHAVWPNLDATSAALFDRLKHLIGL